MMKSLFIKITFAVSLVGVASIFAIEPEGWEFELTPYAWVAGLEGDITVNGREADFKKSASDLFDALDVGGSLFGTAQHNRFLLLGVVDYFSLSTDELDIDDRPGRGSLDTELFIGELGVGYQFDGFGERQTIDVLVGARTLNIENDFDVFEVGTLSRENDLIDPIVVIRPSIPLFPSKMDNLRFNATLAVGGGNDADLVYELAPNFQYHFNENVAARLGYRRIGFEFEGDNNDDNELNFDIAGFAFGVGMTF